MNYGTDTPLRLIKGVGETTGNRLARLGLFTVGDLVSYFPRRYEYRGETVLLADAEYGALCSTVLTVCSAPKVGRGASGVSYVKVSASDESGTATLTFFNQPWLERSLTAGRRLRVWGRVKQCGYSFEISSPEIEPYSDGLPAILPVYGLSAGVTQQLLRRIMPTAADIMLSLPDVLPDNLRNEYGLMPHGRAVYTLHFPESRDELEKAKHSLAFEELLVFQLAVRALRGSIVRHNAPAMSYKSTGIGRFFGTLPFELTEAQKRVVKEVLNDLCRDVPMCRMVQGDVGCGKTVIAAAAMLFTVKNGLQCALMAPTEILAAQHYETLTALFSDSGVRLALLTGSSTAKEKREIKRALKSGEIAAVVGTNAIIQPDVEYKALGLVITDEQHRFGVMQRSALADKAAGLTPHSLVMSATPIPRSLSLVMYGDMDVSVIDTLPPGRQPVCTKCTGEENRAAVYEFLGKQIRRGRQAYIICPLVEENGDDSDKKSALGYKKSFDKALPGVKSVCLHGRMRGKEKDAVMQSFATGEADVLISTTVVEVGVNVPNATVMLIENAECFGLSQLHQLRGRVGRGSEKAFCILLTEKASDRLEIMCKTTNGFEIAEYDLERRGPGDFFGSRQSGDMHFRHASALDMPLIEKTRTLAAKLCEEGLQPPLEAAVRAFFEGLDSKNIFN